jgi:hypothetical protein
MIAALAVPASVMELSVGKALFGASSKYFLQDAVKNSTASRRLVFMYVAFMLSVDKG